MLHLMRIFADSKGCLYYNMHMCSIYLLNYTYIKTCKIKFAQTGYVQGAELVWLLTSCDLLYCTLVNDSQQPSRISMEEIKGFCMALWEMHTVTTM
jgi:hypothetical protein